MRDILFQIYSKATGKDQKVIHADCERNKWLNAEEMVEYGLIDEVLTHLPERE